MLNAKIEIIFINILIKLIKENLLYNNNNNIMNTNIWIDKYRPHKIVDIYGNKDQINSIISWLLSFPKNRKKMKKLYKNDNKIIKNKGAKRIRKTRARKNQVDKKFSNIIITGNHGVGKTVMIDVILKEYNCDVQLLNFSSIKNKNNMKRIIKTIVNNPNVINKMKIEHTKRKNFILVIDELETITSTADKNCILELQKNNEIEWTFPIIFISNNRHNKLLSDIKKNTREIKIHPPFESHLKKILLNISKKEKIKFKNELIIQKIIDHSQFDIRRLILTLQDIYYAYGNKKIIDNDLINEYCDLSKEKDVDFDLFNATKGLLFNYKNIDECLKLYETEKVLLPLMVHENYNKYISTLFPEKSTQVDKINKISECLSRGDITENYIYGDQNWDMQDIHGFHTCVITSFNLFHNKNVLFNHNNCKLVFTSDLNKTSIKKINKKNINNANKCFKNMQIMDYIYINKLIKNLIENNEINKCVNFFNNYNIKLEHIESLLKIDKINSTKNNLASKQKKEFLKFLP